MSETPAPQATPLTKYYKFIEPAVANPPPPSNYELVAFEYRGFLVSRSDSEYLLWSIKTKEDGKPPIDLRSSFTTKTKAVSHIDDWWRNEEKRKELAEAALKESK